LVEQPFDPGKFALRLLEIYNAPKAIVTKPRFMPGSQPARTQQVRGLFPEILSKLAKRAFAFFAGNLIHTSAMLDTVAQLPSVQI